MTKALSPTSTEAVDLFQTVTKVVRGPKTVYYRSIDNNHHKLFTKATMKNYTNNPYVQQILDKGRDYVPTAAPKQEFPKTIHGRTFETQAEYDEAIAEFLNGN